jgi:hypothetical protein
MLRLIFVVDELDCLNSPCLSCTNEDPKRWGSIYGDHFLRVLHSKHHRSSPCHILLRVIKDVSEVTFAAVLTILMGSHENTSTALLHQLARASKQKLEDEMTYLGSGAFSS